jgi:hypothetical protein
MPVYARFLVCTRGAAAACAIGLLGIVLGAGAAAADPTPAELTKARSQFQQALALETAGDWAGSLGLLQEVAAVKMTPQVRFNMALCEEHLGRLAMALGDYKLALVEAEGSKAQNVAEQVPGKIEALNARIPKIVIKRGTGADFATISLDGVSLGPSSIGSEMPVDPGPHTIEARAPGFNMFMNSFNIAEKELKTIDVTLAKAAKIAKADPSDTGDRGATRLEAGPAAKTNYLPYVVGGSGVAVLVAGGVFYVLRNGAISELDPVCGPNRSSCPAEYSGTRDKAALYTTLTNVCGIVGVLGIGAGVTLYFVTKPAAPSVALTTGPGGSVGAAMTTRF